MKQVADPTTMLLDSKDNCEDFESSRVKKNRRKVKYLLKYNTTNLTLCACLKLRKFNPVNAFVVVF